MPTRRNTCAERWSGSRIAILRRKMPRRSITSRHPQSRRQSRRCVSLVLQGHLEPGLEGRRLLSLAQIAVSREDFAAALDFASRSIDSNALDVRAQNLRAAVLRHLGRNQEALQVLASASHAADRWMCEPWPRPTWPPGAKRLPSGWRPR